MTSSWDDNYDQDMFDKISKNVKSPQDEPSKRSSLGGLGRQPMQTARDGIPKKRHKHRSLPESNPEYQGMPQGGVIGKSNPSHPTYSSNIQLARSPSQTTRSPFVERSGEESMKRKPATSITPGASLDQSRTGGHPPSRVQTGGDSLAVCSQPVPSSPLIRKRTPQEQAAREERVPAVERCYTKTSVQLTSRVESKVKLLAQPPPAPAVTTRTRPPPKVSKEPEVIQIDDEEEEDEVRPLRDMYRRIGKNLDASSLKVDKFEFGSKALELPLHMVLVGSEAFEYHDKSKKCRLVIDKGEWFLWVPDKWTHVGLMQTRQGTAQQRQLDITEAIDTDLISSIM